MKYFIFNQSFNKKTEIVNHVRNKLTDLLDQNIYEQNENYDFLLQIIKRHKEYNNLTSNGLKGFKIVRNVGGYIALRVISLNDEEIEFSWVKSCTQIWDSEKSELNKAMRRSIVPQILQFKQDKEGKCNLCDDKGCEVDHVEEFYKLRDSFIALGNTPPVKFDKDRQKGGAIFKNEDSKFEMEWVKFHKNNAILQLLCKKCHLNKSKNRY